MTCFTSNSQQSHNSLQMRRLQSGEKDDANLNHGLMGENKKAM